MPCTATATVIRSHDAECLCCCGRYETKQRERYGIGCGRSSTAGRPGSTSVHHSRRWRGGGGGGWLQLQSLDTNGCDGINACNARRAASLHRRLAASFLASLLICFLPPSLLPRFLDSLLACPLSSLTCRHVAFFCAGPSHDYNRWQLGDRRGRSRRRRRRSRPQRWRRQRRRAGLRDAL